MSGELLPKDYAQWLSDLKARINQAQQRATLSVNRELIKLYWQIGKDILARQGAQGWGAKVIDRLALDLRTSFPEMRGFSRANLLYMRAFAQAWPDPEIVQQAVGQLPWGHNIVLLTRLKSMDMRLAYANQAIEHGWSRNVLGIHIETQRLERSGQAVSKVQFHQTIKDIEKRLNDPNLRLESAILTPTPYAQLIDRGLSRAQWAARHVYFMDEKDKSGNKMFIGQVMELLMG
jgi:predicted nuclease of restriction endonuclease-like (RecB) superfamily